MFERFTDRARRVVVLAQEEARLLNHNYIGTEHILLGLIHEGEGVAAKALTQLGVSLEAVRAQVTELILLGLLREGQGVGAQVLVKLGAGRDQVRQAVVQLLAGYAGGRPPEQAAAASRPPVAPVAGGPGVYAQRGPPPAGPVVAPALVMVEIELAGG